MHKTYDWAHYAVTNTNYKAWNAQCCKERFSKAVKASHLLPTNTIRKYGIRENNYRNYYPSKV